MVAVLFYVVAVPVTLYGIACLTPGSSRALPDPVLPASWPSDVRAFAVAVAGAAVALSPDPASLAAAVGWGLVCGAAYAVVVACLRAEQERAMVFAVVPVAVLALGGLLVGVADLAVVALVIAIIALLCSTAPPPSGPGSGPGDDEDPPKRRLLSLRRRPVPISVEADDPDLHHT